MRGVLVQVRKNQQKFQHSIALTSAAFAGLVVQIVHDRQRVGQ